MRTRHVNQPNGSRNLFIGNRYQKLEPPSSKCKTLIALTVIYKRQWLDAYNQTNRDLPELGEKIKDQRGRALIAARLFRLANGLAGDVKPIGGGLSELRIHYGAGFRIYFRQQGNELIILLCGGDKSTQQQDTELAKRLDKELRALK